MSAEPVGCELWYKLTEEEALEFFSILYCGKHHIPGKLHPFGFGWCVNDYGDFSTWDLNKLTRLVFLAHDRCIRAEVLSSGPRMVKIALHKRKRIGGTPERHPTIDEALRSWRERHPESEVVQ